MYTVKQLSELAGVSVRTLHYYDEIDLLHPSKVGENNYRYYDDAAVYRLQQILFYREIGLELMQIKEVMDSSDFDLVSALRSHRTVLQEKINRLQNLIGTVDNTISDLTGGAKMSKKRLFEAFSDEQQKEYEREARLEYGPDNVNESIKRWNSYTEAQKMAIGEEGEQVYRELMEALEAGTPATDESVQSVFARWHQHLRYFYEPTLDLLRGLGMLYNTDARFMKTFADLHPDLPPYLEEGITQYVDDLEYAEIERMLAEDEANRSRA